ncbi:MAG: hypothetical protein KDB22_28805, partial [Planctomycetales bacterium]|nr:hypothetical protein [Planctomycetales bacterium]
NTDRLVAHLRAVREVWLESPYEGGSPPRFIIECSRRRIPRGVGVEIVGMTEQESAGHFHDCDCPICNMLADGRFGVAFDFLDGHHLELDEDFAFSLCETREEWQALVDELGGFDAFDSCEGSEESPSDQCVDEYASAWTANRGDSPLPGDSTGNLKLAFLLSEIVNALQQEDDSLSVRRVNEEFSLFRRCEGNERICAAEVLKDSLEKIASQYPALLSKAADLQSRIDESLRATA